jgi:putative addiction module antidote
MSVKFKIKIVKIGNSLRVTIPKEIAEAVRLKVGDSVNISLENSRIIISKATDYSKMKR